MKISPSKALLLMVSSVLLLQNANATPFFTDQFAYTDGANLGATTGGGGTNWTLASGDVSQIKVTTASTQTSPGGYAPAAGRGVAVTPTGSRKQTGVPFNGVTGVPVGDGNVVYASFLLNVRTLPCSGNMRVAYMHSVAASSAGIEAVVSSTGQVGIQKKGSGTTFVSGTPVSSNDTHLVVIRYTFQTGNDEVAVWVDPSSGSYGVNPAPTNGAFASTTGGGSDMSAAITYFIIESAAVTGPVFWIDEVRVGPTWADVTPSGTAPPSISSGPSNQTAAVGQSVTFAVQAGGTPPLSYQWYFNTNILLSAKTNSTLTLINVQLSDEGGYSVLVSNAYGSVTSAVAQLSVSVAPPSVETDPQDQSVFVGQDATFNVLASGTAPLFYQWYYNTNSVIGNETNSSVTVTNAQLSDSGAYSVLVSNAYGSVTSAIAQLLVNVPVAPSITGEPQDQYVYPGATAVFNVTASGSEPLSYQWYFNNSTLLTGATLPTLSIANAQLGNAGNYSVVVSNLAGSAISSNAVLTINTNPVAPVFITQPVSQVVPVGGIASFTALASGTQPITYQWHKNGVNIPGASASTLTLTNVHTSDNGSYRAFASNSVGTATSSNAVLIVTTAIPLPNSAFNLVGFAQGTIGGGVIPETDPAYRKVYTPTDLRLALADSTAKVIEIMNDLNLGWNEIGTANQTGNFGSAITPAMHPTLIASGVTTITVVGRNGLTIFSANGATLRHAEFNVKRCHNILFRNLKFDEMWEWDESSKGGYDKKDWDFMTIGDAGPCTNVWIDHCDFTKAYDGVVDIKKGNNLVTISWCRVLADDGGSNSFVRQQIEYLETNGVSETMYDYLRSHGFSKEDIITVVRSQKKGNLVGATDLTPENADINLTLHHIYYLNLQDRMPRLRGGNSHVFNIYVDDVQALADRRLRDARISNGGTVGSFSFGVTLNGSISTEHGAVLVEKSVYKDCMWPLRNNQTDTNNPAYTGKIMALDSVYHFDNADSSTIDYRGDSTNTLGSTYFGPKQATIIPFSWNTNAGMPSGQLPYAYAMDDPSQLQAIVTQGAGAGVLTWNKTNWLMTTYAPTAPIIAADPQSQTVTNGQSVTLTVIAGGSTPLFYQWYVNTNSPIANATNLALTIASVQPSDIGAYSVIVSNSAGTATSAYAALSLTATLTPFESWQMQFFGCTNCPESEANSDPDGDGMNNQSEFVAGTNPTNNASVFWISTVAPDGNDIVITWTTGAGRINRVQATPGDPSYTTNDFADISDPIIIPANPDDVTTNYVDVGGATNVPARFYRVRIVP